MKLSILALTIALSASSAFAGDTYKCFLDSVPYKTSPIVEVSASTNEAGKHVTTVVIYKNYDSYKPIYKSVVKDNSEDVLALYEAKGFSLSFYMDESDVMGFAEGTIKSPVMNGDLKCLLER